MTQRTLDKMERAMKALNDAYKSFAKDVTLCKDKTERDEFFKEYNKFIDLMKNYRAIISKVETDLYLQEQRMFSEALDRAVARWEVQG